MLSKGLKSNKKNMQSKEGQVQKASKNQIIS